ncbi:hypothetical protein BU14_0031s0121 [Porphyra umbilicalis]|uniref:IPT/TIG domain-containing protein n=1 Tax=Porphyra umbilicalis TaxID=2786 RepID=A0A1X6PJC1_PORUM|nr:hypothetical protein BU14_0031s0121 [Porphyra umbilicalis]|eukprot:OSX80952.1 hypothetical protein BU14_0031s0121 [Porphyra umbilicalis]
MDDRGSAAVALDGSGSHTHNSGGGKAPRSATALGPESGYGGIVAMTWSVGGVVIGTGVSPMAVFPVGTTTVLLTVKDWTGDVHAATTKVVVRGDTTPGLWCYYTPAGAAGGRPTVAAGATTVWFAGPAAFGGAPFARGAGAWTARCVGSYVAKRGGRVTFSVLLTGGTVKLSVGGRSLALTRVPWSNLAHKATTSLPAGLHPFELTYIRRAGAKDPPSLRLNMPAALLSHQSRTRMPVVSAASPASGALAGGARLTLIGTSLARTSAVTVGGRRAKIVAAPTAREQQALAATRATVLVPPGTAAGPVDVVLTTPAGVSNPVTYTYLAGRAAPDMIAWRTSTLKTSDGSKDFKLAAGTTGALGPDRRLYVGCTAGGRLFRLDVDWLTYRVKSACSVWLGGQILGVSFNPADVGRGPPRIYVSIADISKGAPWTGGRVLGLLSVGGRACFGPPATVVSGLPVQVGHDHSIGRPAYTQQGDMLLPVGGVTNVGIPHPASGSLDESPLSAAIVKVPLSKRNFNGRITYSTNNASTARVTGGDVQVWASGVRNGLTLVRHSMSDTYWILDNGPNIGYGDVSKTCSVTAPMDEDARPETRRDKLLRVAEGGYYGHPNRNRGRDDPRQCTYHLPMVRAPGYTPALAYFEPSSNGLEEMRVNIFRGALKGHMFFSRFASGGKGLITAATVNPRGVLVGGARAIRTVKYYSGLSITVDPYGGLVMPRVRQGIVAVLIPIYKRNPTAGTLVLSVTPNRGPRAGNYRVFVSGFNFGEEPVVTAARKPCKDVVLARGGLTCTLPPGTGRVGVLVNGVRGSTGHDFEYLNV